MYTCGTLPAARFSAGWAMGMMIDKTHSSPNFSSRHDAAISMLVLHATVGSGPASLAWLCNPQPNTPDARVSSHFLIYKTGYTYQLVDESNAAWHAGKSAWRGLDSAQIQAHSIGIELENDNTGHDPYPPAQLDALLAVCRPLVDRYYIDMSMVVRHLDIATPPGRKTDPAGFPGSFLTALYPPPTPRVYQVAGLPVYQQSTHSGPIWGYLPTGEQVQIDNAGNGHLADGRGFVDMVGLRLK